MPPVARTAIPRSLVEKLERALRTGEDALSALADAQPVDERDRLLTLQVIHDLHVGDIDRVGDAVRWQHHPAVAALKTHLEQDVLAELDAMIEGDATDGDDDAVATMRVIARQDLVPRIYEWVAADATWDGLVDFLALEGGPDAGFDDLVAACQIGLRGEPKLELARNYWDEMGRGELDEIHTELHHDLCEAIDMPHVPRSELPTSALLRSSLGGILATNRVLQPEMVGALGLLELQAGPRCRQVVKAFDRLDAPAGAYPFYVEHRDVDPHHGKAWLDNAIAPLAGDPRWAAGMVRGARWRSAANAVFFADMAERFADVGSDAPLVSAVAG
ncbi:MAG TPA: iron-containing redox enzyme family protein [Acidimicrobiales bacterium]|nr:iron-containing redox enzyme family protein [Acidimicrobiales bacterium]